MKKLLIGATTMLVCVGVFAQGKLAFINNSDNLIYFTTDTTKLATGDAGLSVGGFSLAGSGAYTGAGSTIAALTGSPTLIAGLFAGASQSSLALLSTTTIAGSALEGQVNLLNVVTTGLPAGTPAWFQVQVYDSGFTSAAAALLVPDKYGGAGQVFQATPQNSVYSPMWVTSAPVSSTWTAGNQVLTDFVGFPGYFGGIALQAGAVPEPGTFALAGLGLAALLVLRRRS
jgi:hypothetical protein